MADSIDNVEIILVWPAGLNVPVPQPIHGYSMRPLPRSAGSWWVDIQQKAVPRYRRSDLRSWLARYRRLALPDGILVVLDETNEPVATAGSLTSPRVDLFPDSGEVGWVATIPEHRQRGLATWLCTVATQWLKNSGYKTIFLTTGEEMLEAIRLYLRLGFVPHLNAPYQRQAWHRICQELGLPCEPEFWSSAES